MISRAVRIRSHTRARAPNLLDCARAMNARRTYAQDDLLFCNAEPISNAVIEARYRSLFRQAQALSASFRVVSMVVHCGAAAPEIKYRVSKVARLLLVCPTRGATFDAEIIDGQSWSVTPHPIQSRFEGAIRYPATRVWNNRLRSLAY